MIDTRLITLITLLETKNYTKTAEILFITQPAVTHHIKSLEKENGISLFSNSKTFKLSPSGSIIAEYAKRAYEQYKQLKIALEINTAAQSRLNFSVTNQIAASFMRPVLEKWLEVHPNDQIAMQVDSFETITKKLRDGVIDFAIIDNSFDKMKFDFVQLHKTSIVLAVGHNSPLSHKQRIRIEQLKDECLILDTVGSGIRSIVENELQTKNIYLSSFSNIVEVNDPQVAKNLVINNYGVSLFYLSSIQRELSEGKLKIIETIDFEVKQEFNLISSLDNLLRGKFSKVAEEMISFNRENLLG